MGFNFGFFGTPEHRVFNYKPRYYDEEKDELRKKFGKVDGSLDGKDKEYVPGSYLKGSFRDGNYQRQKSEGLDFPGRQLELAVIVGIPFAHPSAKQDALIGYCQNRFGNGWDMAVRVPAVRKMRQAIGRLIRSEGDRGMAVILDRRVASLDGLDAKLTSDPVAEVRRFFQSH